MVIYEMNEILELFKQDYVALIMTLLVIMVGVTSIVSIIEKFSLIINRPVRWLKNRNDDHELLLKTVNDLAELHNKHEEDTKQSIRHDEMIREDFKTLNATVNEIIIRLDVMQNKIDATEMAKLKDKIVSYYRKYSELGEWERFEHDVFWSLYDSYINHGGNSFVKDDIEPVMRKLKVKG